MRDNATHTKDATMITLTYVGTVGSNYSDANLIAYLRSIGMQTDGLRCEMIPLTITKPMAKAVISWCLNNEFEFVMQKNELTVCESESFWIEW